jgi:hypothetical protein
MFVLKSCTACAYSVKRCAMTLRALLFTGAAFAAGAQEGERITASHQHAWYTYAGSHSISERWALHLEGQWRREGVGQQWMQYLLRPGIIFELTPNVTLSGGYGFVRTFPYGEYPALAAYPEHRFWQQALVRHKLGSTTLQHRYRLEQRDIGEMRVEPGQEPRRVSWRYENRFRYMVRAEVPLTHEESRPDWYVAAYDEVMVNFGRNVAANIFDQNRAYIALGKAVTASTRIEAGYLHQTVQQRNGRIFELNHTLMLTVTSSFPFRGIK